LPLSGRRAPARRPAGTLENVVVMGSTAASPGRFAGCRRCTPRGSR
jgi:hypothetical protein